MNVVYLTASLVLATAFSASEQRSIASTPTPLSQLLAGSRGKQPTDFRKPITAHVPLGN